MGLKKKSLTARKPKGQNRIAKCSYGYPCLREENLSFNNKLAFEFLKKYLVGKNIKNMFFNGFKKTKLKLFRIIIFMTFKQIILYSIVKKKIYLNR
jgi:hypothetical protein